MTDQQDYVIVQQCRWNGKAWEPVSETETAHCQWLNPAYPFGPWGADCGALWEFETNDPADDAGNPVKYCPNCGLPVLLIKV